MHFLRQKIAILNGWHDSILSFLWKYLPPRPCICIWQCEVCWLKYIVLFMIHSSVKGLSPSMVCICIHILSYLTVCIYQPLYLYLYFWKNTGWNWLLCQCIRSVGKVCNFEWFLLCPCKSLYLYFVKNDFWRAFICNCILLVDTCHSVYL